MISNKIAVIWDFDKTLVDGYMQDPIFKEYKVDSSMFWNEVNSLYDYYKSQGINVNKDTIYLNHFITCTKQGLFKGLDNKKLKEFGKELKFYKGIPEIFQKTKMMIEDEQKYKEYDMKVEHYIVSTGLLEVIKGSSVMEHVQGIWGCEFIETVKQSELIQDKVDEPENKEICQIGYAIDNTSKTRALFEINKGSNVHEEIDVNSQIPDEERRIPFENMIYIADGPSDIPAFSVIKGHGGSTFAIYPKGDEKAFRQVDNLIKQKRINMYAEADYSEGTTTYMWISNRIKDIAERIYSKNREFLQKHVSPVPKHLTGETKG